MAEFSFLNSDLIFRKIRQKSLFVNFILAFRSFRQFQGWIGTEYCQVLDFTKGSVKLRRDGWMTCDFTSFSTVFQSYQDHERLLMTGYVQWNPVYG